MDKTLLALRDSNDEVIIVNLLVLGYNFVLFLFLGRVK